MSNVNPNPTEAQKAAGNYKKRHDVIHGMRVSLENEAGGHRSGVSEDGRIWKQQLAHDYGYIRGTMGRDKDHIDVFLGPGHTDPSKPVHVVDQINPKTGEFDEHKVLLGFDDPRQASQAYHQNYEPGWTGAGKVVQMTLPEFKAWAFAPGRRVKPASLLKQTTPGEVAEDEQKLAKGGEVKVPDSALEDPQFYKDVGSNIMKLGNRAVAGALGMPADMGDAVLKFAQGAANLAGLPGHKVPLAEHPALGSHHIQQLMNKIGIGTSSGNEAADMVGDILTGGLMIAPGKTAQTVGKVAKAALAPIDRGMQGQGALSKVLAPIQPAYAVKPKGGNWTPFGGWETGAAPEELMDQLGGTQPAMDWGDKQLLKYIKNQMGTIDDPLVKLEREDRLHFNAEQALNDNLITTTMMFHDRAQNPSTHESQLLSAHRQLGGGETMSPLEIMQAYYMRSHPAKDAQKDLIESLGDHSLAGIYPRGHEYAPTIGEDIRSLPQVDFSPRVYKGAWLDKVAAERPDEPIYAIDHDATVNDPFQFQHLLDYITHALEANKGLERHGNVQAMQLHADTNNVRPDAALRSDIELINRGLHLTPEQLARSSVADIAAKTHAWNEVLANQKLGELNKGIKQVHKTYPDGHQWVELDPEGLSAEGAAMRHCVGSYCSSVQDGSTRILSLRNGKGEPRVTVELKPHYTGAGTDATGEEYRPEALKALEQLAAKYGIELPMSTMENPGAAPDQIMAGRQWQYENFLKGNEKDPDNAIAKLKAFQDDHLNWVNQFPGSIGAHDIRQIKGPANRKPSAEVIPHVQDLLRGGVETFPEHQWGGVGDIRNAELLDGREGYTSMSGNQMNRAGNALLRPDFVHPRHEDVRNAFDEFSSGRRFNTADDIEAWIKSLEEAKNGGQ